MYISVHSLCHEKNILLRCILFPLTILEKFLNLIGVHLW